MRAMKKRKRFHFPQIMGTQKDLKDTEGFDRGGNRQS